MIPLVRNLMLGFGMIVFGSGVVCGQDFPNKLIRIVTSPPGGGADFVARLMAQALSGPLGQPVVIDNRQTPLIPEIVSKAPPDGYALALVGQGFWVAPFLEKTTYDPVRDFAPITLTNRSPNILVVHPSLPVKSIKDLIALAKAKPGELNYGSSPRGSTPHLAAELFKSMAGVNIVRVGYKGAVQALNDVIAGQVQLTFATAAGVSPYIKAGRLRALAVTSAQPTVLAPGVPTVAATLPGYESISTQSILAPAKTPAAIINRLNQEMVRVLNSADIKEKLLAAGVEAYGTSPEELWATMKAEMARMGKVIKDAGIRNE